MSHAPRPELEQWIRHFRGPLIGWLVSRGADWARAEDLAQDTFAEAWIGRSRYRGATDDLRAAGAWLRGIAFRQHSALLRREQTRAAVAIDDLETPAPSAEPTDPRLARLGDAVSSLPESLRAVVCMRYLEDSAPAEVAALLGLSVKAVERRLHRARSKLRDHLERGQPTTGRER